MANSSGASPHVRVPAEQPNYSATSEAPVGVWDDMGDAKAGLGTPGDFTVVQDFPDTGDWKQT